MLRNASEIGTVAVLGSSRSWGSKKMCTVHSRIPSWPRCPVGTIYELWFIGGWAEKEVVFSQCWSARGNSEFICPDRDGNWSYEIFVCFLLLFGTVCDIQQVLRAVCPTSQPYDWRRRWLSTLPFSLTKIIYHSLHFFFFLGNISVWFIIITTDSLRLSFIVFVYGNYTSCPLPDMFFVWEHFGMKNLNLSWGTVASLV